MKIGCSWRDDELQLASWLGKNYTTYLSQKQHLFVLDVLVLLKFGQVPHANMG
jgi:hypothetical protein